MTLASDRGKGSDFLGFTAVLLALRRQFYFAQQKRHYLFLSSRSQINVKKAHVCLMHQTGISSIHAGKCALELTSRPNTRANREICGLY